MATYCCLLIFFNIKENMHQQRKLTIGKGSLYGCGQYYKGSTIVNYDSRVIPDWKTLHITTLGS